MKLYFIKRAEKIAKNKLKIYCYRKFWIFRKHYKLIRDCHPSFDVNEFNNHIVPKQYGIRL